jgi:lipid II:glycine glycyltransferase (peptidoglycan interpeptide bridge formation enzyme)
VSHVILALHHSIFDIRGIEWYLFEKGMTSNLQYKMRYTGIIQLQDFSDFETYKKTIRKVRLQELANTSKIDGLSISARPDIKMFLDMYINMFNQRGINLRESELQRVSAIIENGLSSGTGNLLILQENDGTPVSGVFILSDKETDFYQFGASDPERVKLNGSSFLLLRSIELAFINGRKYFDMVGMNSPNRGEYKASFNARVNSYFEIELQKNVLGDLF